MCQSVHVAFQLSVCTFPCLSLFMSLPSACHYPSASRAPLQLDHQETARKMHERYNSHSYTHSHAHSLTHIRTHTSVARLQMRRTFSKKESAPHARLRVTDTSRSPRQIIAPYSFPANGGRICRSHVKKSDCMHSDMGLTHIHAHLRDRKIRVTKFRNTLKKVTLINFRDSPKFGKQGQRIFTTVTTFSVSCEFK